MADETRIVLPDVLPILPLRDTVLFPQAVLPLAVGRPASVRLVDDAVQGSRLIAVVTQRDPAVEEPRLEDLFSVGSVAVIHKIAKQPDGTLKLVVQGVERIRVAEIVQEKPFLVARVVPLEDAEPATGDLEAEALKRNAVTFFQEIVALSPQLPDEMAAVAANLSDPGRLADVIAAALGSGTLFSK